MNNLITESVRYSKIHATFVPFLKSVSSNFLNQNHTSIIWQMIFFFFHQKWHTEKKTLVCIALQQQDIEEIKIFLFCTLFRVS